ncbi:subtilase-type protease inhibitor [Streptomyces sp. NBC_01260]|uniref:SSI family serine proteinase inhibitor n=1 Tax=unclassified Streptomyces TaxID=2593676 RepID=UPI000F470191|nr:MULTISPECIES: SSI family serine proteinase inhibitor [unclassified Streptomyces]ROQ73249.1 subtilisin inhibitor-like [Streptomyces sp. CEV 2-1]RPK36384.1 Subtilisin inhibitor-like protein 2 [Streptomyces sp. ADI92-24]
MRVRAVLATAALLPLGAAAPAVAAPPPAPDRGILLTVSGSENTWIRGVVLHCPPRPDGWHPDAAGACAALDEAEGDFDALAGDPHPCTYAYAPVTVTAEGARQGDAVTWRHTFPNACVLDAATGPVFRF